MNVVKKLGQLKQWGKERMGGDNSGVPQDFKDLETEMNLRHDGMEKLHNSMNVYIKSISKRSEGEGKEKTTAMGYLGTAMNRHGAEFEEGNKFGESLIAFGTAHERIARVQDTYSSTASSSWLEALERSMAQLKDYQVARKKLESRRSAYDSTANKIQKAKKDDFKAEEDLRTQKARYEESTEDVYRRMQDIIDAEAGNIVELYNFMEAELNYHDRCREVLITLKRDWPTTDGLSRNRSRTNTLERFRTNTSIDSDDLGLPPPQLPFRSRASSGANSPLREKVDYDFSPTNRPVLSRTATNETLPRPPRPPFSESQFRASPPSRPQRSYTSSSSYTTDNVFGDPATNTGDDFSSSSPDKNWEGGSYGRSSSPATSVASLSRNASWSALEGAGRGQVTNGVGLPGITQAVKKAPPPPPPPSRATKPKAPGLQMPPPPPLKRSALSTTTVPAL